MDEKKYVGIDDVISEIKRFVGYLDDDMLFRLATAVIRLSPADVRQVTLCKNCWFYNQENMWCTLHEADFSPGAYCSYATTDGKAEYWGLSKEDHNRKRGLNDD